MILKNNNSENKKKRKKKTVKIISGRNKIYGFSVEERDGELDKDEYNEKERKIKGN